MHDGGFTFNHLPRWEYPDFWLRRFVPRAMVVVGSERSPLGERQRGGGPPPNLSKYLFYNTPHPKFSKPEKQHNYVLGEVHPARSRRHFLAS